MRLTAIALGLLLLTGCSSLHAPSRHSSKTDQAKPDPPETVIVTYHVKPGDEAALQNVLARAWKIYQKEGLVNPAPHVIFRDDDAGGTTKVVEIFTWINHAKPEHAPPAVKTVWNEMMDLCEPRDDHPALHGGEIHLLTN
jgi:hypothetical protein